MCGVRRQCFVLVFTLLFVLSQSLLVYHRVHQASWSWSSHDCSVPVKLSQDPWDYRHMPLILALHGFWGSELRSSHLQGRHFNHQDISPGCNMLGSELVFRWSKFHLLDSPFGYKWQCRSFSLKFWFLFSPSIENIFTSTGRSFILKHNTWILAAKMGSHLRLTNAHLCAYTLDRNDLDKCKECRANTMSHFFSVAWKVRRC